MMRNLEISTTTDFIITWIRRGIISSIEKTKMR